MHIAPQANSPGQEGLLELLGVHARETSISRLLARLIAEGNPDLLRRLVGRPVAPSSPITVATEWPFRSGKRNRRADILAAWREGTRGVVLVIEHKINAFEGADQTADYVAAREAFAGWGREALGDTDGVDVQFRVVSLLGDPPADDGFAVVRYDELAPALRAAVPGSALDTATRDWVRLITKHAAATRLDVEATLGDAFAPPAGGYDPRFGRFVHLVAAIVAGTGNLVQRDGVYRTAASSRAWFGAHLTRPHWLLPAPHPDLAEPWLALQFRVYVAPSAVQATLALYHEPREYQTLNAFQQRYGDLEATYRADRNAFAGRLGERIREMSMRWRQSGHWCQIAAASGSWKTHFPLHHIIEDAAREVIEAVRLVEGTLRVPATA